MKGPFQNDGPTRVSDDNYQSFIEFCESKHPNFDQLYYVTICDRNHIGFRRLCARTLLRQISGHHGKAAPYCTGQHVGRIFNIGGKERKSELYWTLYNRTSLGSLFSSEMLYNYDHNYYDSILYNETDGVYDLTLFLLTLPLEEDTAKRLWEYHPLSQTPASLKRSSLNTKSYWLQTLETWAFQKSLPDWIRQELWDAIVGAVQSEANRLKELCSSSSNAATFYLDAQNCQQIVSVPYLVDVCFFLEHDVSLSQTGLDIAEALLTLLEDLLPEHVAYLPARDSLGCLAYADAFPHNEDLTQRIMRRHLPKFELQTALTKGFRFSRKEIAAFYSVVGRTFFSEPLNSDLIDTLRILRKAVEDPANQRA